MQYPNFNYEKKLWSEGIKLVAGCDEVGRGSLAGPVVAGVVLFSREFETKSLGLKINDSKKLTPQQREILDKWIRENALAYSIGVGSTSLINKKGIVKATNFAYRSALKQLSLPIQYLLIDAFYIPRIRGIQKIFQLPIIRGDSISMSIAAASIIAKVHRDNLMKNFSKNRHYGHFQWNKNKGYGTKEHKEAIQKYGPSKLHRKLFIRKLI